MIKKDVDVGIALYLPSLLYVGFFLAVMNLWRLKFLLHCFLCAFCEDLKGELCSNGFKSLGCSRCMSN